MKFFLIPLIAACAFGQMTTITGKIAAPTTDPLNGTCSIQAAVSFTGGGFEVLGAPIEVKFTAGILRVSLLPTDTVSPPGMYYRAQCRAPLQTINGRSAGPWTSPVWTWAVPTSSSPIDISVVNQGALLSVIGVASGNYCIAVAGGAVSGLSPGSCASGGGMLFDSATGLFDSASGLFDSH